MALIGARRAVLLSRSSVFTPASVSGLHTWVEADSGAWQDAARTTPAVAVNDPIGGLTDLSGNAHHFAQSTAGLRPLLKSITNNNKTFSAMLFDATDDLLATSAFSAALAQQFTAVIILNAAVPTGTDFFWDAIAATDRCVLYNDATLHHNAGADGAVVYTEGSWDIFITVFNGASSVTYKNGPAFISANAGTNSLGGVTLGARYDGNATVNPSTMEGHIAAFLLYSGGLSQTSRSLLFSHFGTKYGVTVS